MTWQRNGMINLVLLDGLLFDLRNKMSVEIAKFEGDFENNTGQSSLGDFQFADKNKIIGTTAQIMQNYFVHEVNLPHAVLRAQRKVLRDFCLMHPLRIMKAIVDNEEFEKEETLFHEKF